MKKLSLLLLGSFTVLCTFAQVKQELKDHRRVVSFEAIKEVQQKELSNVVLNNGATMPFKTVSSIDTAFYYLPEGAFNGGFFASGSNTYPRIIVSGLQDVKYVNGSNNVTSSVWSVNNTQAALTQDYTGVYAFGGYYLPKITTPNGASYIYGEIYPTQSYVLSGIQYTMPLTNCAMYTSTTLDEDGFDAFRVGAGTYGSYSYGSNLTVQGSRVDTLGSLFENTHTLWVDSVFLPIYNNTLTETMIPSTGSVKLTIYHVNKTSTGYQMTDSVIATATATVNDYSLTYTGTAFRMGNLNFVFKKVNALGVESPSPAILDGMFFAQLTGFNESNCKFGIFSDYYNPASGNTFYTIKGNMTTLWSSGGSSIAMSLNGILPVLEADTTNTVYNIPTSGGYATDNTGYYPSVYATFKSDASFGGWDYANLPSWLTVATDTTYYTDYNYISLGFSADALPAGTSGRTANVTISSLGKKVTYTIIQGTSSNVETTSVQLSKVVSTDSEFKLSYPSDFNTVTLFNVNGQSVGKYDLPSIGKFEISNTNLAKGVYLLKFEGTQTETVKVIK